MDVMMNNDEQEFLDAFGEKWVITFDNDKEKRRIAFCNSYLSLPNLIKEIRHHGGKNIVIKDATAFFSDDNNE